MPDTEITRAETSERARLLRVRSQGPETFGWVSLIRFDCREAGAATHADLIATGVREILLNGAPLDPQTTWADGRIMLPGLRCFDQPDLKAVFTFQVTAPEDHAERPGTGVRTVRFLPTPPVPTFTTTVVAGDYRIVTTEHTTPDGQQMPLDWPAAPAWLAISTPT